MGSFVNKVTDTLGLTDTKGDRKAASQAAGQQLAAAQEQTRYLEGAEQRATQRLQPFVNLGTANIPGMQSLLSTGGQMQFLETNPIFQAAVRNAGDQLKTSAAAAGKFGSGGLVNQLFQNYLSQGEGFINNQYNRLSNAVGMGQASAAGQAADSLGVASQVGGILGDMGDIRAGATIARQNASNQGMAAGNQLLQGGLLGSGLIGGGGLAGGGLAGAGLGALMFSDERLKEDIERVGETDDGIPIYRWRYKGDEQVHIGPMAQDVEKVKPNAVLNHSSGYKVLNLEAL